MIDIETVFDFVLLSVNVRNPFTLWRIKFKIILHKMRFNPHKMRFGPQDMG